MGEDTKIQWAHHTFNPWWGCVKVSPGCEKCYAETFSRRTGNDVWGPKAPRRMLSEANWAKPVKWNKEAERTGEPTRVFCASMCDVFELRDELQPLRDRLWALIESTPHLTWLLLTKRPNEITDMIPEAWRVAFPPNVWLGTTAESQEWADKRLPYLLEHNVNVHFVSYEPALGPWDPWQTFERMGMPFKWVDWIIVGGESGPGARPFNVDWARAILNDSIDSQSKIFVKQLGAKPHHGHAKEVLGEGRHYLKLSDRKGGDPSEWPEDLRVREFPGMSR